MKTYLLILSSLFAFTASAQLSDQEIYDASK